MKKNLFCGFLMAILLQTGLAQTTFKITSYQETPQDFKYLLLQNSEISRNDTINEKILDLVEPILLDSVIEKKRQFHRVFFVGWLIHAFGGYDWRALDMHKQKFVGTAVRNSRSGEERYTEYDINFDLNFHLKKYLLKVLPFYDKQKKIHRQDIRRSHRTNYDTIPFVRDTNNIDIRNYRLHCELTPPRNFRPQLHYLFYATQPGLDMKDHPNFGSAQPSMGFYGTNCLDCSHACHPELHPYEWVWWLKANDADRTTQKIWLIGLFHEGSKRLKEWSQNPMTGSISIPFAFKYEKTNSFLDIYIEHLVLNSFNDKEIAKLSLPETNVFGCKETAGHDYFTTEDGTSIPVNINFNYCILTEGLKYWFSDLNYDKREKILGGQLHFATSAQDLYTTRITFTAK